MIDQVRIKQLIRWAEDKARDHESTYEDIASHRAVSELLIELLARRQLEEKSP